MLSGNRQDHGPGLSPFEKSASFAGGDAGVYKNRALVSLGKGVAAFDQGDFDCSVGLSGRRVQPALGPYL